MRISAIAEIKTEVFETNKEAINREIKLNLCVELIKNKVFIEPPTKTNKEGYTTIQAHFFALSFDNIRELKELSDKYPEITKTLNDIIVRK